MGLRFKEEGGILRSLNRDLRGLVLKKLNRADSWMLCLAGNPSDNSKPNVKCIYDAFEYGHEVVMDYWMFKLKLPVPYICIGYALRGNNITLAKHVLYGAPKMDINFKDIAYIGLQHFHTDSMKLLSGMISLVDYWNAFICVYCFHSTEAEKKRTHTQGMWEGFNWDNCDLKPLLLSRDFKFLESIINEPISELFHFDEYYFRETETDCNVLDYLKKHNCPRNMLFLDYCMRHGSQVQKQWMMENWRWMFPTTTPKDMFQTLVDDQQFDYAKIISNQYSNGEHWWHNIAMATGGRNPSVFLHVENVQELANAVVQNGLPGLLRKMHQVGVKFDVQLLTNKATMDRRIWVLQEMLSMGLDFNVDECLQHCTNADDAEAIRKLKRRKL